MKNTKLIAGIIVSAIGLIGMSGIGTSDSKVAYAVTCLVMIGVGALLILLYINDRKKLTSSPRTTKPEEEYAQKVKAASDELAASQRAAEAETEDARQAKIKAGVEYTKKVKEANDELLARRRAAEADKKYTPQEKAKADAEYAEKVKAAKQARYDAFAQMLNAVMKEAIVTSDETVKGNNVKGFVFEATPLRKNTARSSTKDFTVIDVETTGLRGGSDKILELSAIRFENYYATKAFTTYINPGIPIPEEATNINGITDEMVADAPAISNVMQQFKDFVGDGTVVGQKVEFDLKFLVKAGFEIGEKRRVFDTLEISKKVDKDVYDHKLGTICAEHGIYTDNFHSSLADCYATGLLFIDYLHDVTELDSAVETELSEYRERCKPKSTASAI